MASQIVIEVIVNADRDLLLVVAIGLASLLVLKLVLAVAHVDDRADGTNVNYVCSAR